MYHHDESFDQTLFLLNSLRIPQQWKGGKREAPEFIKSETTSTSEDVQDDGEIWTCECGNKIASDKTRCGNCRHWRGGRRQGGWTLGTGKDYDSDDGIDRTQDWTCCGGTIPAKQTRCGKCNGWRGGKRVYSNAAEASPPLNLPPWVCFKCLMSNPGNKKRCGGCLSWKSSGAPATSKPSRGSRKNAGNRGSTDEIDPNAGGHWKCVSCNFDNFSRELSCFICQSMRPNHQWHKKQQLINSIPASSTQHTAETAATNSMPTAAVLNANPAAEAAPLGPVHASTVSIAGGSTTNNQGATANGNDVSVVDTISNPPDTMNYYGTFNESLIYPYISIHYDFNRAYYYNHDYTYLNAGVGSIRDDSGGDDGTSFAEKTNND